MIWCNRLKPLGMLALLCLQTALLCGQVSDATAELKLGISAYEKASYEVAVQHLQHAVSLDPKSVTGHLYLAKAYDGMCPPAGCDPDWSKLAIQEYETTLQLQPNSSDAAKGLASLLYLRARLDESERYYRRAAEIDSKDPEALYGIAVLDWIRSYRTRVNRTAELKLGQSKPLYRSPACAELRGENLTQVTEGIALMTRTLELARNADVMGYLAVLYRERAELQCGDRTAHDADFRIAREWETRRCEARNSGFPVLPPRWPPAPPPPPSKRGDACAF
jgi:tetratricopeptide (TPR) repeat protein